MMMKEEMIKIFKEEIIEIFKNYTFNISSESGHEYDVIDVDDFPEILDEIIKLIKDEKHM
jgi:hypothetical protein